MEELMERARLGDYSPSGPTRLDIVGEYLRSFLPPADEEFIGAGWGLTLEHREDGVFVEARQFAAPKRKRDEPVLVAVFSHTFPASCFADAEGLAAEACELLPEEFVVQKWTITTAIHTVPTTPKEAERIRSKVEVHAAKVRGVEFATSEVANHVRD